MISSYLGCLRQYGLFKGRTNPIIFKEFLFFYLILAITFFILWQMWDWGEFNFGNPWNIKDWSENKLLYGSCIFLLLHIPALLTASVRRLTDAGYKKNALILILIPILGWLSLLHLLLQPTHSKFLGKHGGLSEIKELNHPLYDKNLQQIKIDDQRTKNLKEDRTINKNIQDIYNQELGNFSKTDNGKINSKFYHSTISYNNRPHNVSTYKSGQNSEKFNYGSTNKSDTPYKISVLWLDFYLNCIEKYATFKGDANRGEFFSFIFFLIIFSPIPIFLDGLLELNFSSSMHFSFLNMPNWVNTNNTDLSLLQAIYDFYEGKMFIGYLSTAYFLLSITPFLALQSRRINDTGKNGVSYLWYFLVPVFGWFILLFISLQRSKYNKLDSGHN